MILAGIDIGTNTLRLLIAEAVSATFSELHSDRRITRLGQDIDQKGVISPDAWERTISALADFKQRIDYYGVREVLAVGTSALRNAANASAFSEAVLQRTGIRVRVISGKEEARLTLLGVLHGLQAARVPLQIISATIIDIGGGSTEFITKHENGDVEEASLPLGAVYLTDRFLKHDPPLPQELSDLRLAINNELKKPAIRPGTILVGTAGTVTTIASMDLGLTVYDPRRITGHKLQKKTIDKLVVTLARKSISQRRGIPGLEYGREDIILAGAMILQEFMKHCRFEAVMISDGGLREGILLHLYARITSGFEGLP